MTPPRFFADPNAPTRRPPSSPQLSDQDVLLGQLAAAQARLENAWQARATEYETFARQVTHLQRSVDDLEASTKKLHKLLGRFTKVGPAIIAIGELLRALLQSTGHHP